MNLLKNDYFFLVKFLDMNNISSSDNSGFVAPRPDQIAINPNQSRENNNSEIRTGPTEEEIEENIRRFGWALPYPQIKEPDEELDDKWGSYDDYKRYKNICYNYGIRNRKLVTRSNLLEVYGKTYEELNEAEKAAYTWVEYRLEYYFEVCCRSW